MSLRFSSAVKRAPIASVFICALAFCAGGAPDAVAQAPAVQTYTDQAVPMPGGQDDGYYNSPVSAGSLTLQDVLEAHKPIPPPTLPSPGVLAPEAAPATAPLLAPPAPASSTSQMMSQGMKAVFEKLGKPPQNTPAAAPAQSAAVSAAGLIYQPGEEPKNLATGAPAALVPGAAAPASDASESTAPLPVPSLSTASASSAADTPASVPLSASAVASAPATTPAAAPSATTTTGCYQNIQKWQKSCADVGYPANYVGKISGETRTACSDGSLHDFWVSNDCAPPETSTASARVDAVCGEASDNQYDDAPTANLCAQGIASATSGDGPWTWACSGMNGGKAAACTARKRMPATDGACGSANGVAAAAAPSADLCASGSATAVAGSGPWNWSCQGVSGGSSQSCIAPEAAAPARQTPSPVVAAPVAAPAPSSAGATGSKGDLCGEAAETLAVQAPDRDLCRVGTPGSVSGDGPWNWSCTDNDGRTSSCSTLSLNGGNAVAAPAQPSAPPAVAAADASQPATPSPVPTPPTPVAPACGIAASQPTPQAPTVDLCAVGRASAIHGDGPWTWTCKKGRHKVSCVTPRVVDGSCGPANGAALKSAPFAGLCASGTPTGIAGDGPWTWACNGAGGGVNVSCAASIQGKVQGACGGAANTTRATAPDADLCASGTPSAVNGAGPWSWSCSGANGGDGVACNAAKAAAPQPPGPKVDGLCGAANGVTSTAQPSDGLCADGSPTATVGNGPWNWDCVGENGGMTVSCTAPLQPPAPLDGLCGQANGVPTMVQPENGLCSAGITGTVSGSGPWTWTCSGVNGGNAAACVAPIAGKTGALPSVMTTASSPALPADIPPPPTGLVTPQLPNPSARLPALDKNVIPSLTSSAVPLPPAVAATPQAPAAVPPLSADSTPVPPPPSESAIEPAPALQPGVDSAPQIPGNHLTLDPTISTILFTHGSGNIDEQVLSTLDRLAAVLSVNPDVRITLIAYADNTGSTPRDARRLSLTRALAVRDYLGSKGVAASRIDVRAEGANSVSGYIDRVDVKVND